MLVLRACTIVMFFGCRHGFDPDAGGATDARPDTAATSDGTADVPASIATITFGERPTSQHKTVTIDTTLNEGVAIQNNGGSEDFSTEASTGNNHHGLVRFDLTSVPAGTLVVAAQLRLGRYDTGDEVTGVVSIRRVTESWVEGTSNGTPGSGATWNSRDGVTAWSTAGGTTSVLLASATPTMAETTFMLSTVVVQEWIDTPSSNHGMLIAVDAAPTHYHFHASESLLVPALLPELALDLAR